MITFKQVLGALLLAILFIAIIIMMVKEWGWKLTITFWGLEFILITIITLGIYLLFG